MTPTPLPERLRAWIRARVTLDDDEGIALLYELEQQPDRLARLEGALELLRNQHTGHLYGCVRDRYEAGRPDDRCGLACKAVNAALATPEAPRGE